MSDMNDNTDAYTYARSLERNARESDRTGDYTSAIESWKQYAVVKEEKGSHLLSIYGHLNVARNYEKIQNYVEAAKYYVAASSIAKKIKNDSMLFMLSSLASQMYENAEDGDSSARCYEGLGKFFDENGNFFLSADAYEHAAEVMSIAGKDCSDYEKPIDAWKKNAEYWKSRGEMDDAEWSLQRVDAYKSQYTTTA